MVRVGLIAGVALVLLLAATTIPGSGEDAASKEPSGAPPSFVDTSCERPYSDRSPWNTPIGPSPIVDPRSAAYVASLGTDTITSDPTEYSHPIYEIDPQAPVAEIYVTGVYSNVIRGTKLRRTTGGRTVRLRLPAGARGSEGSDSPMIVVNPATGDEWGFWRIYQDPAPGRWRAQNGYHYNTRWSAVPPKGFGSGGAGIPYLAGRIRPCEIRQGHIDHALAFAYDYPSRAYVYPATKSDGSNSGFPYMPEGTRLQLDPSITDETLESWGCWGSCLVIAHALQQYGMYVINKSGRDKIYAEDDLTAGWIDSGLLTSATTKAIRKDALRVVTTR